MTSTFEGNLKAFERYRPILQQRINEWLRDHPEWDPTRPSHRRRLTNSLDDLEKRAMVIVLGFSTADDLQRLLSKRTDYQKVIFFIERDIEEFIRIAFEFDFSQLIQNPAFLIYLPEHLGEVPTVIRDFMVAFNPICSNVGLVMPSGSKEDEAFFKTTIEQIARGRELANLWIGNDIEDSLFGLQNTVDNLEVCSASIGFAALHKKFAGFTAISVASGPSLNEALPFLKAHKDEFVIIACDSSLKPLFDAGIMPHFVTALEREEIVTTYFKGVPIDPSTTLIGPHVLLRSTLEAFRGHRAIYSHNTGIGLPLGFGFLGAPFATGFSAGNLNISAALYLGFSKIVLVGHNLGYEVGGGASHAQGVLVDWRSSPNSSEVLDKMSATIRFRSQDGTCEVRTDSGYAAFKKQIEDEIGMYPDREFVNTAMKGVKIEGTKTASLDTALGESDRHGNLVREFLKNQFPIVSAPQIVERKAQILNHAQSLCRKMKAVVLSAEKHLQTVYRMKQKLAKSRLNPHLHREATNLVNILQAFRDGVAGDPHLLRLVIGVLQPAIAPLERGISLLNKEHSDEEELLHAYFDEVAKILSVYCRQIPRIIEIVTPLTKISGAEVPSMVQSGLASASVNEVSISS